VAETTESFIDGQSMASEGTYLNIDPSTGETLGDVGRAGDAEIDCAVTAARRAHEAWRVTTPEERSHHLIRLAQSIMDEVETLARWESEDSGKPLSQARNDVRVCARYFDFYGHVIESYYGVTIPLREELHVFTIREPYGVTGHILAWNYPLQLFARGVAPSVATGNCVVVKPADETPRTAVRVAQLAVQSGFPVGVINVVTGLGPEAGAALSRHPGVDHLGFVGSTDVGSQIAGAAAARVIPVVLELGGKSAQLVFEGADMDDVVPFVVSAILQNAGQTCSAGSRVLVHETRLQELVDRVASAFANVSIGPALEDHDLGPLISRKQQQRVKRYVDTNASGEVVYGGMLAEPSGISTGAYFQPTLICGVDPASPIAQEEVFGPVLTVTPFSSEDEAVAVANGTAYALLAAVWTKDLSQAHRLARRIVAGQVYVNTYGAGGGVELPFGGFRRSGYGREKGIEALDSYTATKTVIIKV
jgi:aldehyde dehydrogenase (NAD+)